MRKFTVIAVGAISLVWALAAQASIMDFDRTFYCNFHFDQVAWGKPVQSVMAHTGAWLKHPAFTPDHRNRVEWVDVQDIALEKRGDHFFGKAMIDAQVYYGSLAVEDRPIVQFWVNFADGTSTILPETFIQKSAEYQLFYELDREASQKAIAEFEKLNDASTVSCFNTLSLAP